MGKTQKRTIYGYIAIAIVGIVISVGGGTMVSISDKITSDWDEPWPTIAKLGSVAVLWIGIGALSVGIVVITIGGTSISTEIIKINLNLYNNKHQMKLFNLTLCVVALRYNSH